MGMRIYTPFSFTVPFRRKPMCLAVCREYRAHREVKRTARIRKTHRYEQRRIIAHSGCSPIPVVVANHATNNLRTATHLQNGLDGIPSGAPHTHKDATQSLSLPDARCGGKVIASLPPSPHTTGLHRPHHPTAMTFI